MSISLKVAKLDDVEEKYRAFYTEKDGEFHLDDALKPADPSSELSDLRAKVGEFRDRNIELDKQKKELEEKAGQTDAAKAEAEAAKSKGDGLTERLAALETDNAAQKMLAENALAKARRTTLTSALEREGIAQGVDKKAIGRFAQAFTGSLDLDDTENVVIIGENGPAHSRKAPDKLMPVSEFVGATLEQEPFWTAGSVGDGGPGPGGGGGGDVTKMSKKQFEDDYSLELEKKVSEGKIIVEG